MIVKSIIISGALFAGLLACPTTGLTAKPNAEQAAEKAAEALAERAVEKVAETVAERAAQREERPDKLKGPTEIHFMIFVIDIDNIDGAAQSFAANFYVSLRWKDERLTKDAESVRQIPLK